jgi:hypothetical protein
MYKKRRRGGGRAKDSCRIEQPSIIIHSTFLSHPSSYSDWASEKYCVFYSALNERDFVAELMNILSLCGSDLAF